MNEKCYNVYKHITRLLWLARAARAKEKYLTYNKMNPVVNGLCMNPYRVEKWEWVERKCLDKAEQFK